MINIQIGENIYVNTEQNKKSHVSVIRKVNCTFYFEIPPPQVNRKTSQLLLKLISNDTHTHI